MEFIRLIKNAESAIKGKEKDGKYAVFADRYKKMQKELDYLQASYICGTLNNRKICLNITRMTDYRDDDGIRNAVAELNRYYQEHIYRR